MFVWKLYFDMENLKAFNLTYIAKYVKESKHNIGLQLKDKHA